MSAPPELTNLVEEKENLVLNADDREEKRQVPFFDALCHGSNISGSSRKVGSKAKRLLAELKARQLKESYEFELRSLEERHRRDLLKAHHDLELARLEEDMSDSESLRPSENSLKFDRVRQFVSDCHVNRDDCGAQACKSNNQPDDEQRHTNTAQSLQVPVCLPTDLPKVELTTFDGCPTKYWKFIKQFDYYIAAKVKDDGQRLLYLLHYCKGNAREAIDECVMLPSSSGYQRARNILRSLFGQTHVVARALLDDLLKGVDFDGNAAESLSHLAVRMENCAIALQQMDYEADLNALSTLERVTRKLPAYLQYQWAEIVDKIATQSREPNFADLTEFISTKARVARSRFGQLANENRSKLSSSSSRSNSGRNNNFSCVISERHMNKPFPKHQCAACAADHLLTACPQFISMTVPERWRCAKDKGLCFACLCQSHRAGSCDKLRTCDVDGCKRHHHRLLHLVKERSATSSTAVGQCAATGSAASNVSLGLLPVKLRAGNTERIGYAFLDSGSDATLITEDAVKGLGLKRDGCSTVINTVGGKARAGMTSSSFEVISMDGEEIIAVDRALIVRELPVRQPAGVARPQLAKWSHLSDLPPNDIRDGKVLLLLGCDVPEAHWGLDQRVGGRKQPFAVKTLLGWVVYGPMGTENRRQFTVNCTVSEDNTPELLMRKMYDAEFTDAQSVGEAMSVDDAAALKTVESGTRFRNGHFTVPMPWKNGLHPAFSNYSLASARLRFLKRKLLRDDELRKRYANAMQKNVEKGYAILASDVQAYADHQTRWYLPHHAVINPKKPEKLRVVLDCAAKCNGKSLNDFLHSGPDITSSLIGVLLRFRKDRVAVVADIEEMFMQVRVPDEDQGALRYLWWPDGDVTAEPKEYQMTRHPFGATSSPFCANFALRKTARTFGTGIDESVVEAVEQNFYVDDCLISFQTVDAATKFVSQIDELLRRGGFLLKKWTSNFDEVLAPLALSELPPSSLPIPLPTGQRALGIEWDVKKDVFRFRFQIADKPLTRRGILSIVSSLFDPLGLIAPLCLPAKQLLQKVCKAGGGWDQLISEEDVASWTSWVNFVRHVDEIEVARTIRRQHYAEVESIELHVFCDASEVGYGAVAYARCIHSSGEPYCVLLFSKSRVVPIKPVTIPRLELAAAVLGVRIGEIVKGSLPNLFAETFYWTDSMIVLYYIRNTVTRFSTFVANRLAVIHQYSSVRQWRHVASESNPADYSSRGITSMRDVVRWLRGPTFMFKPTPATEPPVHVDEPPSGIELKRPTAHVVASVQSNELETLLTRYGEWIQLLKGVAWLSRFVRYIEVMHGRTTRKSLNVGDLTVTELETARRNVIAMVQAAAYGSMVKNLPHPDNQVKLANRALSKLCPILLDGILCVGGRLTYSDYPKEVKHPAILPSRHFVTELIIKYYHQAEGHNGPSHVLAAIRRRYWIVKGGSAVKRVIGNCMTCRRLSATAGQQMMAPLPLCRVQKGWSCFTTVGVDLFGPFLVRRGRGTEKRYGCIFTCLQTRAVHLEIATNLSTDSFIMVLMRFIARRGNPKDIYSDNGSNFVGAVSELKELVERWDKRKINDRMLSRRIQWHFNPPSASHRGGVWERMIRSVRKLLLNISDEQLLTDEALLTYLVEVERILNNRPIVPQLSSDKNTIALSPSSLLLLRDSEGISAGTDICDNYSRRWKQVNYLAEVFWRRWVREYLPTLQTRQKWISKGRNFRENDVVLVMSMPTTRGKWPLGVVESCVTDSDGLVRTVYVRTSDGIVERDVRKVCLLEGAE